MRRFLFLILIVVSQTALSQTIEAESGTRTGTQISTARAGYTGTGFVTGFDADNDKVSIAVQATAGLYKIFIRYASASGDKWNFVYVNGQNLGSIAFPLSASFKETLAGKVWLKEGSNIIEVVKEWGYFDVDNIRLEASSPFDFNQVVSSLVTPSSTRRADSLYQFLRKTYGKVILSGQYGGDTELKRIKDISGKVPVIRGFDLIDYSPSRVEHGATSTEVEKSIAWDKLKGITTYCWHWNAPKDLIDQPGKEWWRGFYTDATNFDVTKAMNSTSSEEYNLIIRDIDAIAVQLKRLKDANVPVLWRPLHEAEGKWFWWGAKGAEPCKWLWKLLYDRLVNEHQLNNLIWVWTSTGNPDAAQWYPGDNYVDIVGADIYLPAGTYSSSFILFDNMATIYSGKKIITMSENGTIPDPQSLFDETSAWSFFGTWAGNFITDGQSNSPEHVNKVFNHEYVITLDEIGQVDAIIAALQKKRDPPEPVITAVEDDPENAVIAIYDLLGRRITAEWSTLPSGIYIVRFTNSTIRILKQE
ncbi:MAG TPA: glycosyl hydrolase [Cyclobacteriaceae bacterium]|nr:glycosyl hydrolase [Cyclobacteriaceae bacterium]